MGNAGLQRRRIPIEIQHSARVPVVFQRLGGDHLVQHTLRVHRELVLPQRVAPCLRRRALREEFQRPRVQPRVRREPESECLVLLEQGLQQDPRCSRRGPHERMARGDHPGIAPARLTRHGVLPFQEHDLVPVLEQLIGGGDADHPASHDQDPHGGPFWGQKCCRLKPSGAKWPAQRPPIYSSSLTSCFLFQECCENNTHMLCRFPNIPISVVRALRDSNVPAESTRF